MNVQGGKVREHVQAFADAVSVAAKLSHISTYPSHQPAIDRALDIFPKPRAEGDKVAQYAIDNYKRFGVDYVIWKQRIWNPEISPKWRPMADRGGDTANHFDHVHISFEPTAPAKPDQPAPPKPQPEQEDIDVFIIEGFKDDQGNEFRYLSDGLTVRRWIQDDATLKSLRDAGVKTIRMSKAEIVKIPEA